MNNRKRLFIGFAMCFAFTCVSGIFSQGEQINVERISAPQIENIALAPQGNMAQGTFTTARKLALGYWLYTPGNLGAEKLPLIIYLHGSNIRGNNLSQLFVRGLPQYLASKINIPAIVVCPQCPSSYDWGHDVMQAAITELVAELEKNYPIDEHNICLTGHSLGGWGVWYLGSLHPGYFARFLPISGDTTGSIPEALASTPTWIFVAESDNYGIYDMNVKLGTKLQNMNGNVKMTLIQGTAHGSVPNYVYFDRRVIDWLLGR